MSDDGGSIERVFISYRRADSNDLTGRLNDYLATVFETFKDSYSIQPGDDWRTKIRAAIVRCDVLLVVIGQEWLRILEERRSQDDDWVREEVMIGLASGKRVMPVLVNGATMPSGDALAAVHPDLRQLASRHAAILHDDPHFRATVDALIRQLGAEPPDQRRGDTEATRLRGPDDFLGSAYKPEKLIGRDAILQDIRDIVAANGRVLLRAHGGAGKTAIAATAAYNFVTQQGKEALWLRTGSSDTDALAESLGGSPDMRRAIAAAKGDAKAAAVRDAIGDAALLVLDDCWNGRALGDLLKMLPPSLPVIATARNTVSYRHLRPVVIDDLPMADAMTMLKYYAAIDTDMYDADIEQLCAKLGRLAFAIEIAGSVIQARDDYIPVDLLRKLEEQTTVYEMTHINDSGGLEENRRNVAALIETSLHALPDDDARNVFFAFGAFETPVNAAELITWYFGHDFAVSDDLLASIRAENPQLAELPDDDLKPMIVEQVVIPNSVPDFAKHLETLADHGLARRFRADDLNIETYRVHDVAHEYARDQRSADDVGRAIRACLAYTGRYAEPSLANFKALRPLLELFIGAARMAFERGQWAEAEQFAWDLYRGAGTGGLVEMQGYTNEAITLLDQAARAAAQRGDKRDQGAHLGNLGLAYADLGEVRRAIDFYEQRLAIAREIGDRRGEGNASNNLGLAYWNLGEVRRAIDYHEQSLAVKREIGDRRGEGNSLGNLGLVYADLGEVRRAIDFYEQVLEIMREIGDRRGEGNALGSLGNAYYSLGEVRRAIDFYEQRLAIAREIGDRRGEGQALGNLGNAYADLGEVRRAIDFYEQALVIDREIGDLMGEGTDLNNLGVVYEKLGDYARALELYQAALVIRRAIGNPQLIAQTERNIADAEGLMRGGKKRRGCWPFGRRGGS